MRTAIIIPARFHSTRLPGKLLLQLGDIPVIQHVYNRALEADVGDVYIATEDQNIADACSTFSRVIMTKKHTSGTSRIAEACSKVNAEHIINIQGDEPFISPVLIRQLSATLQDGNYWVSAYHKIFEKNELTNPNIVKVVFNNDAHGMFFSRSPIPFPQENSDFWGFKHVGVYAYNRKFLETWKSLPPCEIEEQEQLEQLRGLYAGFKIKLIETDKPSIGIDTKEDFQQALSIINETHT